MFKINRLFTKVKSNEQDIILGRSSSALKIGIVGMANIGKSSTFNLLSDLNVPAQNRPFCTIQPNTAIVKVPDPRFVSLVKKYNPKSSVPPQLKIIDIAGLVKGASQGYGLGNEFLSHISQVDAIFQVVRCFQDKDVSHTQGNVQPMRDIKIIRHQLCAKDLAVVKKNRQQLRKKSDKRALICVPVYQKVLKYLQNDELIIDKKWNREQIGECLNRLNLLTSKPILYCLNTDEKGATHYQKQIIQTYGKIPFIFNVYQQQKYKSIHKSTSPNIHKMIQLGYQLLGLIHFFTVGKDQVKCWTLRKNSSILQAASLIHSDLQKGFLSAEVANYNILGPDLEWQKHSKKEGKNYLVKDGDILVINSKYKR